MATKPDKIIWPSSFPPNDDEVLSSWLVRLAHAHHHKVHTFCTVICPQEQIWTRDLDLNPPQKLVEQLVTYTIASEAQVNGTMLGTLEGIIQETINHNGANPTILPLGVFHRKRKLKGQQYCVSCLVKDGETPYFRRRWRLSFWTVCEDCGCYLDEECPHCQFPINFFRQELGKKNSGPGPLLSNCYNCQQNITHQNTRKAPDGLVEFQSEIYRATQLGYYGDIQYSHLFFKGLFAIIYLLNSGSPAAKRIQNLISVKSNIIFKSTAVPRTKSNTFNRLSIRERVDLMLCCHWLFDNDYMNFRMLMEYKPRHFVSSMGEHQPLPFWLKQLID